MHGWLFRSEGPLLALGMVGVGGLVSWSGMSGVQSLASSEEVS